MWKTGLRKYLDSETDRLLQHFNSSSDKYVEIWNYYKEQMPICIKECSDARKNYGAIPDREGPQGIYWIGKDPLVFFIGREHYGWYGEAEWADNLASICYSPLMFSLHTVESMGSYWAKIKDIMEDLFGKVECTWDNQLRKVAFSNACKCLSSNNTYQWNMQENCQRHRYLSKEIAIVGAKVNVLFTKSHPVMDKLFDSEMEVISQDKEFSVNRYGAQIMIECAHPGRESNDWRHRLKGLIEEYISA